VVVSEYGIADLRGKSDRDCIAALLNIADSRFQDHLLADAKRAGKIERSYVIPERWRENLPVRIEREFGAAMGDGVLPPFPFGTDFTEDEITLGKALKWLEERTDTRWRTVSTASLALLSRFDTNEASTIRLLGRMSLDLPKNLRERLYRRLLSFALAKTQTPMLSERSEQ
jgi:hypothetical protein